MADLDGEKRCSKCKERKPYSEFYADPKSPDKRAYWCKACSKESSQQAKKKKIPAASTKGVANNQPPGTEEIKVALGVLFFNHQELIEKIEDCAQKEYRPPEMQILFWLDSIVNKKESALHH